jgi:signal transduction histidine kinase
MMDLDRMAILEGELLEARRERDALRQRAEESEALHVLGLAANRSLDPDEVLTLVSRFIRTLLGADYVTISTADSDVLHTVAAIGLQEGGEAPGADPFAAEVVRRGKPLNLADAAQNWREMYPFHAEQSMTSGLGVPLSLFGHTFGALVIGYRRPHLLESRDTRLALTLAGHAAVAISNARLHRALADRSSELERAYEQLRWSTEAKERFFANMSHELRTPLNAILGYQSLLMEGIAGDLSEPQRAFAEKANRATRSLLFLVNDVLDLSKIEAGKMEPDIRTVRPSLLVGEAVAIVQPLADSKGIELRVPRLPQLPELRTDADRVHQILLNLLSNAVKFTDRGAVTVAVSMETERPSGGTPSGEVPILGERRWLAIRVSDTGPGIPAEDQERIFQEFEQVSGAAARGGTGLGLTISRKLARMLGGELVVSSTPGAGSTFTLRLPVGSDAEV